MTHSILSHLRLPRRQLSKVVAVAFAFASFTTVMSLTMLTTTQVQAAPMTEAMVQNYAADMKQAANSQNINQVARLVSDDALISLSRKGKTTSLDKNGYLKLLQSSWSQASGYSYDIRVSNIVTSGEQAKADVRTVETWTKDGKQTSYITTSRATLTSGAGNAVLLRAVSQLTIN